MHADDPPQYNGTKAQLTAFLVELPPRHSKNNTSETPTRFFENATNEFAGADVLLDTKYIFQVFFKRKKL